MFCAALLSPAIHGTFRLNMIEDVFTHKLTMIDQALPLYLTDKQILNPICMHGVRTDMMESYRPRGPPPPLPTTPKPKTAVTREITFHNASPRPKTVHRGLTPTRPTGSIGNPPSGNRRICRRHTEKHKWKLTELPEVLNRRCQEELRMDSSFLSTTADSRSCLSDSPSSVFIRNSPVRRATRRVSREIMTSNTTKTIPRLDEHLTIHSYPQDGDRGRQKQRGQRLTRLFQRIMLV